jgi:hypothetical protein
LKSASDEALSSVKRIAAEKENDIQRDYNISSKIFEMGDAATPRKSANT